MLHTAVTICSLGNKENKENKDEDEDEDKHKENNHSDNNNFNMYSCCPCLQWLRSGLRTLDLGLEWPSRLAITVEVYFQNVGVAMVIVRAMFTNEEHFEIAVATPLIYGAYQVSFSVIIFLFAWKFGLTYAPVSPFSPYVSAPVAPFLHHNHPDHRTFQSGEPSPSSSPSSPIAKDEKDERDGIKDSEEQNSEEQRDDRYRITNRKDIFDNKNKNINNIEIEDINVNLNNVIVINKSTDIKENKGNHNHNNRNPFVAFCREFYHVLQTNYQPEFPESDHTADLCLSTTRIPCSSSSSSSRILISHSSPDSPDNNPDYISHSLSPDNRSPDSICINYNSPTSTSPTSPTSPSPTSPTSRTSSPSPTNSGRHLLDNNRSMEFKPQNRSPDWKQKLDQEKLKDRRTTKPQPIGKGSYNANHHAS